MVDTKTDVLTERKIAAALPFSVAALIAFSFGWRMFSGLDPAVRFSDDFFYYVVPAGNWVDGAGSTFFPGEPTNGYHPLWFLWLSLLRLLGGGGSLFFGLVDLSIMVLLLGFLVFFERFLRRTTDSRIGAAAGAGFAAILLSAISTPGVETALAAFSAAVLLSWLSRKPLAEQTVQDAAVVGLLSAFLFLSRLDAVVLVLGLVVAVSPRWDWRRLAAAVVGAAPAYAYLAFNLVVTGHLGTTSMSAKTVGFNWPPNLWFLLHPSPVLGLVTVLGLLVSALAIFLLLRGSERADVRRIGLAIAAAPVLQLVIQAFTSGWGLFPWYFYLFDLGLGLAVALLTARFVRVTSRRRVSIPIAVAAVVLVVRSVIGAVAPDPWQVEMAQIAQRLKAFAGDHPGVYAMGDAAGTTGWMIGQPVVQVEGLVMSHEFLDRIRQQQPLDQVFRDYKVAYYVNIRPGEDSGGCSQAVEPNPMQSSYRAPHMSMTICAPAILEFELPDYHVKVYEIDPATGKAT